MSRKIISFFITFILTCQLIYASSVPDISADGAILIDTKTNTILYAKNMNEAFYPASTTKVLTALAILQDLDPNIKVTKTQDALEHVPSDSSQIGLNVGDQFTVYDGLHAVLMASDNFVCYDLAKKDSGSIPAFAHRMNNLALLAGANKYNFVNPHGYHDLDHYTSPYSLAKIAIAAFENPILEEISGTYSYNFHVLNTGRTIPLTHTAALLDKNSPYYNEHVVAAKTGFHDAAQRTLVAKARYGDMELVGVIMRTDAPKQFEDMNKLFEYANNNFSTIVNSDLSYTLVNHTYSDWAKPYVEEALNSGWITHTAHNYAQPVSKRVFINLLSNITTTEYSDSLTHMIHHNGNSIYTENNAATKAQIAEIVYNYLSHFDLTPLKSNVQPSDIDALSTNQQIAIRFCVDANIFSLSDTAFNPNELVTYEDALCLLSKINGIVKRYLSYNLQ